MRRRPSILLSLLLLVWTCFVFNVEGKPTKRPTKRPTRKQSPTPQPTSEPTAVQPPKKPVCPAPPGAYCAANCACRHGFACFESKCRQCGGADLSNCIPGQKCLTGVCTWITCGNPPSHLGDACDAEACGCPANLICAGKGKSGRQCAECSETDTSSCLSGMVCKAGRCTWDSCGNHPTLPGQPCNAVCRCPEPLVCAGTGLCAECGGNKKCPKKNKKQGFCYRGRCYWTLKK